MSTFFAQNIAWKFYRISVRHVKHLTRFEFKKEAAAIPGSFYDDPELLQPGSSSTHPVVGSLTRVKI